MEEIIPEPIIFEWDKGNFDKNLKKHGIKNEETEQVFINKPTVLIEDEKHSKKERRFLLLGKTNKNKLLSIIFTKRSKNKIRIISSRSMSKKERRLYAKKKA